MIRLFLLVVIAVLLVLVVMETRRYLARDRKLKEYKDAIIEGEIADIELDIAMEEHRRRGVNEAANDLNSKSHNNNKNGEK